MTEHYDVIIIGSGFGGSVAALRLTEKGYRVGVLEAGQRFADADHAKTSWDLRKFVWAPRIGLRGIQRIHLLPDVLVLAGAGVGGGSLNYANTLYEPTSSAFYEDPQWAGISDWRAELAPYYDQAKRMLGVVTNPTMTASDRVMKSVAERLGVAHTFRMTPVGVFFGRGTSQEPGVVAPDPYFGGAGPDRTGCFECGQCMTGCRHGAKNTLVKNYLHLAEAAGAVIHPDTEVTRVAPLGGSWSVSASPPGSWRRKRATKTFTADHVVVAAGTWGTQQLLHRMKDAGHLPRMSNRLGELTRTNSESLGGATTRLRSSYKPDFTHGVAITSSFHPDDMTHVEPCRYGKGSNAMALMTTVATKGGGPGRRWVTWTKQVMRHPGELASIYAGIRHWSERSVITLVMQTHDNSLTLYPTRTRLGRFKVTSRQGHGIPNPTWIEAADTTLRTVADEIDGHPLNSLGEIVDIPMTAHFLGGCPIGADAEHGVVDAYHRAYGHPGLHIVDGSTISANLGVNPSLTITAQAERAMSLWPNKDEDDKRPSLGEPYRRVAPIAPHHPVVPSDALGALHLPIVDIRHPA